MNFIEGILAKLLDSLKAKNPLIYGVLSLVFVGLFAVVQTPEFAELIPGETDQTIAKWVLFVAGLFTGSRTSKVLNKEKENKK